MKIGLFDSEVLKWTKGVIVLDSFDNEFGELFILTTESIYNKTVSVIKFFKVGDQTHASIELPYSPPNIAINKLFRKLK